MTASQVPPFASATQRFDQSTFRGRFCQMLLACDPCLLLYAEEEAREFRAMVHQNQGKLPQLDDRTLWEAKRIADSALHPETNEWIPRPFRMSGYLPANGPICIAMLAASSTLPLLFWSWLNQSQNAMINYYNRSSTQAMSNATLLQSYLLAVAMALSIAFGLSMWIHTQFSGEEAIELTRFVSFPSAVIASSLNCFIVRRPEMDSGVPLYIQKKDGQLEPVLPDETSQAAARKGVYSTTASRAILQMPTYFVPPLLLDTVGPLKLYLMEHPTLTVPITTLLLLISFGLGLPCAVGLFPQWSSIEASQVEAPYRELGHKEFYFNKGL